MTADDVIADLSAHGVRADARLRAAVDVVRPWLAIAPRDAVLTGLRAAADPAAALHGLERVLAAGAPPSAAEVAPLLRLLGGSPVLAATLIAEAPTWPRLLAGVLAGGARPAAAHVAALAAAGVDGPVARDVLQRALRRYRKRELVRIGGRDLLGLADVDETVRELSALAEGVIEAALAAVRARIAAEWGDPSASGPVRFCVLGMGKLGGEELNYSSDIDLVYLYERDGPHAGGRTLGQFFSRVAEELTRAIREVTDDGFCFRVDLRLRPGGTEGPVAVSFPAALSYFEAFGQTWERAAWLKARPVGGDRALGEALLAELSAFVYRRYLDYATLADLEAMKRKVDASFRDPDEARRDVKLGRGGIREVEFLVQAQQLVHAGKDARLRLRGTLATLGALAAAGYVDASQATALAAAYRFLRDVEHKLQVVAERQTQRIPRDPEEMEGLARRLGFMGADGVAAFWAAHARHTGLVQGAFDALFHGAEAERRRDADPELVALVEELEQEERALWRLGRLGFRDLEGAYTDLRRLRDGPPHAPASARRRQALAALAPALLTEIARSAAPERALGHMATFVSTIGARSSYLHLMLENPGVMRLLVRLFATSEFLTAFFLRHPELLDSLVRADVVRVERGRDEMAAELATRLDPAPDFEAALDTLRRFRHEEFLRIGVRDIEGDLLPDAVGRQLTALAEVVLEAALAIGRREVLPRAGVTALPPGAGLAVLGMGKLGSGELTYASDLDLIFVYEAGDPAAWGGRVVPHELFTRVAQRTISALQTPTREGIAYRTDTRLRPSGNQGPLVSSLAAFTDYHRARAQLWERQALVKARAVAGPAALTAELGRVTEAFVYGRGLEPAEVAEIGRMRARIEQERGSDGGVDIKTGRGGLVDVEFLVQMLQLRHGHAHPAVRVRATAPALAALAADGLLPPAEAEALTQGYAFLRAVESRLRVERDQPVEAIERDPDAMLALARRLGYGGTDAEVVAALSADHDRHRAAIRAIYDRHFADLPS